MQERELLAERLRELVRSRVRVPDAEAFSIFERGRSRAVVRSVTLERSWFGRFAIDLDDAAVEKWSKENAQQVDDSLQIDLEDLDHPGNLRHYGGPPRSRRLFASCW